MILNIFGVSSAYLKKKTFNVTNSTSLHYKPKEENMHSTDSLSIPKDEADIKYIFLFSLYVVKLFGKCSKFAHKNTVCEMSFCTSCCTLVMHF